MVIDKGLRVLVPCNRVPNNPFFFNFLRALDADPLVRSVQYGTDWLRFPETPFDVVHLQWPEALLDWRDPSRDAVARLHSIFERWRAQGTVVALTVHNEFPHGRATAAFHALYKLIFDHVDICFHFGTRSIDVVKARYDDRPAVLHRVVPHGCYEAFLGGERQTARAAGPFTVFSLGKIRSQEEVDLLAAISDALKAEGGRLIVAGRLPHPSRGQPFAWARTRWPLWRRANVEVVERFVSDAEVESLARNADVILVPRIGSLNSGNVALAFSLGKVGLGPSTGVIGEELERLGNPTFDPADLRSVGPALAKGRRLASEGRQAQRNLDYAKTELAWEKVARGYTEGYLQCLTERSATPTVSVDMPG